MRSVRSCVLAGLVACLAWTGVARSAVPQPPGTMQIKAPVRPRVMVDQIGYDPAAPKHAIVQGFKGDHFTSFQVVDVHTGKVVLKAVPRPAGTVDHWREWHYWTIDFSTVKTPGRYRVEVSGNVDASSFPFRIADHVLERYTLSNVIYYFKGQRVSGAFDRTDARLKNPIADGPSYVDLSGGWYAATGDYGVHLTEGNDSSAFVYQEVPLVAWSLIATWRNLESTHDVNFSQYELRLLDGATYGADFLVRDHVPGGSFYQSIAAPFAGGIASPDRMKSASARFINAANTDQNGGQMAGARRTPEVYQASFRSGGGMAIAALAAASTLPGHGDFTNARYLQTAEAAFHFLQQHNGKLLGGGKPNIVDDYSALLAATELYRATHAATYRDAADAWADRLMAQQAAAGSHPGHWRAGNGDAPFFNETDEGLPVVALADYAGITTPARRQKVRSTIRRSLDFELRITGNVNNPFGYARQLVKPGNGAVRTAFFMPHDVVGAAPWWQGEDARLASMAAAARVASPLFAGDPAFRAKLQQYAWNQLHWILGRNPYDTCMLIGSGHLNAQYMFLDSWQYTSAPGAIVNGITAGLKGEDDGIAFDLGYAETGKDDDWRWAEQWLPHAAWYLYAISLPHD
ncbi:MAG: glycoside hydrolase family 9 protein [Rhodanobacteraceae bacterium]